MFVGSQLLFSKLVCVLHACVSDGKALACHFVGWLSRLLGDGSRIATGNLQLQAMQPLASTIGSVGRC